jgi:hypothetical protein
MDQATHVFITALRAAKKSPTIRARSRQNVPSFILQSTLPTSFYLGTTSGSWNTWNKDRNTLKKCCMSCPPRSSSRSVIFMSKRPRRRIPCSSPKTACDPQDATATALRRVWSGLVRSDQKVLGIGVMPSDRQLLYSLALPAAADFSQFRPTARLVFAVRIMRGIVCTRMSFLAEGNRAGGI